MTEEGRSYGRIGIGERAGTGLRAIYRDWRSRGRVPPEIENDTAGYEFRLTLLSEELVSERQLLFQASLGVDLTTDQADALALLCRGHSVSTTELSLVIGKPHREVQALMQSLITQVLAAPAGRESYRLAPHLRERWLMARDSGLPETRLVTDQAGRDEASLVTDQAGGSLVTDQAGRDEPRLVTKGPARSKGEDRLARPPRGPAITEPDDKQRALLNACAKPQTQKSLMRLVGVASRGYFRRRYLKPLFDAGLLRRLYPDRPTHPLQRIVLTRQGADFLAGMPRSPGLRIDERKP